MQKIEIHTDETGLSKLQAICNTKDDLFGYHPVKSNYSEKLGQHSSPQLKIEAYVKKIPSELQKLLNSDPSFIHFNISECEKNLLFPHQVQTKEAFDQSKVIKEQDESLRDTESYSNHSAYNIIKIDELPNGRLRLSIESDNTTYFLFKICGVLAQNNISLYKAHTSPQHGKIIGSFVIPRVNGELLKHITLEFQKNLCLKDMGNGGFKSFTRSTLSPDELHMTYDTSGSLTCLKVKCEKNDVLTRFTLLEAISLFNLEISISRLGGLGTKIDDSYYIKPINNSLITEQTVGQIVNHLTGVKS